MPPGAVSPRPDPPEALDPAPLFSRQDAELIVPRRELDPVYAFFFREVEGLTADVEHRFWGFSAVEIREDLESFGLYFLCQDFEVPFLWFGLGWGTDDAPGTLPSWGASLQINGSHVGSFRKDVGGLRPAWEAAAKHSGQRLGLYLRDSHVELAEWRSFEWLLGQESQLEALHRYWSSYLDLLHGNGVGEAVDEFIRLARRLC